MHIPDLAPLTLPTFEAFPQFIAVGWLESGHEFPVGAVDQEFAGALSKLLVDPWQPVVFAGRHICTFCRLTGGPATFRIGQLAHFPEVTIGCSNLWLPADGFLYVAPSMILHYMDAHQYQPPTDFQAAVVNCPPMRSTEYFRALLKNGPKGIVA